MLTTPLIQVYQTPQQTQCVKYLVCEYCSIVCDELFGLT